MKIRRLGEHRTVLEFADGAEVLFSYSTPVAAFIPGEGYTRTEEVHSRTTSKHIGLYIGSRSYTRRPQAFFDTFAKRHDATVSDESTK